MGGLSEDQWDELLRAIDNKECTPVIGAGASRTAFRAAGTADGGTGPDWSAAGIAQRWAAESGYPFTDKWNLQRVAQYLAIEAFPLAPKRRLRDELQNAPVDISQTPYPVLAGLPIPLFITTNYDDLIERALEAERSREDWRSDHCRWNDFDQAAASTPGVPTTFQPSAATPFVYHLHGRLDVVQSLVLTEEDYLDFLITLSEKSGKRSNLLHPAVRTALAGHTLLFIGYSLSDSTFRVVFRGLMRSVKASVGALSVSIQVDPAEVDEGRLDDAKAYLEKYFGRLHGVQIGMYWGEANRFAADLAERWAAYPGKAVAV